MVQRMLDGIRVQSSLVLTMAKEHVLNTLMWDWLGAVAHMSIKVAVHFLSRAAEKRKSRNHRKYRLQRKRPDVVKVDRIMNREIAEAAVVKMVIMSNNGSMTLIPRTLPSHSPQRI